MGNNGEAPWWRRRWPLLVVAVAVLVAVLVPLGFWLATRSTDDVAGARTVAVTYTRARLTHNYSGWWDSVAPACRPASSKSQWMEKIRAGYQSLGTQGASTDIKVQVTSLRTVGDHLRLNLRVTYPAPPRSGDLEVDVQQQANGSWRVVGYGTPGDADRCDVL